MEATRGFLPWGLTCHTMECPTHPSAEPCAFTLWLEVGVRTWACLWHRGPAAWGLPGSRKCLPATDPSCASGCTCSRGSNGQLGYSLALLQNLSAGACSHLEVVYLMVELDMPKCRICENPTRLSRWYVLEGVATLPHFRRNVLRLPRLWDP